MASTTLCARESEGSGPALLQATGWEPRRVFDIGFAEPSVDGACGDKRAEDLLDPARIFRTPIAAKNLWLGNPDYPNGLLDAMAQE